jgi:hypothetical protein
LMCDAVDYPSHKRERKEMTSQLRQVADDIDRLITLDLNRRGVIKVLHEAARARSGEPLVQSAGESLQKHVTPGSVVLIATGWPDRPWISTEIGELDGPPGAALLGRSIHHTLGAVPVFLIEDELRDAMISTARAAGFAILGIGESIAAASSEAPLHAASVLSFPKGPSDATEESRRMIDLYKPTAVIAVEKGSANEKGTIHNARGMDTTACMAKVDELVRKARSASIVTVGVGDGGNEIGMGRIRDTIRSKVPYGSRCACPCGGGIAPVQETDLLVTSTVSNWGAYGIAAYLAVMNNDVGGLHDEAMELRTLREAADAGLIDGNTGYVDPGADGIPQATHAAVITVLRQLVINAISPLGLARVGPIGSR